jgi:hypothetical protein
MGLYHKEPTGASPARTRRKIAAALPQKRTVTGIGPRLNRRGENTMRVWAPLLLSIVVAASSAGAQQPNISESSSLQPQTQGAVSFVSGGSSSDERDALRKMQSQYNLRLQFAVQRSGEYLANVNVTLTDAKGGTVLDTISDGPFFFAQLTPGRYRLTVTSDGKSETRNLVIPANGAVAQDFYWPAPSAG